MTFRGIKALSLQHKLNAFAPQTHVNWRPKGRKKRGYRHIFVQNLVFLDFQNHKITPFHRLSFLFQEFTEAILLSFFRTERRIFDYSSSCHLQGLLVRSSVSPCTYMLRKNNATSQKGCDNHGCEEFDFPSYRRR